MASEDAVVAARNARPTLLIWIDAERAVIARWTGEAQLERIASAVPARHESTGHVRFDPVVRHGGGGAAQDKIERDREGHLREYLSEVARRVGPGEDVEILGPGGVREDLARTIRLADLEQRRRRTVVSAPSPRLTDRQLIARVRERVGASAPRVHPRRAG